MFVKRIVVIGFVSKTKFNFVYLIDARIIEKLRILDPEISELRHALACARA